MTLATTLILIVISITIGFLIGALVYGLRGKPSQHAGTGGVENEPKEQGVRLWRDPLTQNLSVTVDGETYQQAGELAPEARSRLSRLARDWQIWLGMPSSRLAALVASSSPESAEPRTPVQTTDSLQSAARSSPGKAPQKPAQGAKKNRAESAPLSIAAQIDAILQARLENTPLAGRGIRLEELPGQGMVVMVGDDKFTDLTLVPDQQVRAAIADAVAEWEKKNAPWG
jgi:hypothetical protein